MTVFLDTVGLLAVWEFPEHLPTTGISARLDLRRCFETVKPSHRTRIAGLSSPCASHPLSCSGGFTPPFSGRLLYAARWRGKLAATLAHPTLVL